MVPINYFAIIVAAIIEMGLGFLWYGPLFGDQWRRSIGKTSQTGERTESPGWMTIALQIIGALLTAYTLANAVIFAGAYLALSGFTTGIFVGIWSWIGFIAPVAMGVTLWEKRPWAWWLINAGYYLIAFVLMGILLALWV